MRSSSNKFIDLQPESKIKVSVDVRIPTKEHPEVVKMFVVTAVVVFNIKF